MTIFRQSPKLSPLPVVARHYACSTYSGVAPLSVDVVYIRLALCPNFGVRAMFLFLQSRSYKYFRFCRQLTSTVENVSLIVALGQILLSGCQANNVDLE